MANKASVTFTFDADRGDDVPIKCEVEIDGMTASSVLDPTISTGAFHKACGLVELAIETFYPGEVE